MSPRVLTCVYCGHEYPQDTPAAGSVVLTEHIAACEAHPMRQVVQQRDQLRAALVGMIGADGREELGQMRSIVALTAPSGTERDIALAGIDALIATLPGASA